MNQVDIYILVGCNVTKEDELELTRNLYVGDSENEARTWIENYTKYDYDYFILETWRNNGNQKDFEYYEWKKGWIGDE